MMSLKRNIVLIFIYICISTFPVFSDETTQLLTGSQYYEELSKSINGAEKTIYASLYMIILPESPSKNDKILSLLNLLIEAKKRGVEVKIILDYSTPSKNSHFKNFFIRNKNSSSSYQAANCPGAIPRCGTSNFT